MNDFAKKLDMIVSGIVSGCIEAGPDQYAIMQWAHEGFELTPEDVIWIEDKILGRSLTQDERKVIQRAFRIQLRDWAVRYLESQ